MTLRQSVLSSLVLLAACGLAACDPATATPPKNGGSPSGRLVDESTLPKLPHFDVAEIDTSKAVCLDLDAHVNGKWLAQNPVPADKTTWGTFEMLNERSLAVQKQIVEAAAKAGGAKGTVRQQIGDLFATGMDEAKLEADGIAPIKAALAEINGLKDASSIATYLRDQFAKGNQFVFSFGPGEDFKDAKNVIGYAMQDGLSLPEKAYYSEAKYQDKRDAFLSHIERMLVIGGVDAAAANVQAKAVLAFETRLAAVSLSPIEMRDPANMYSFVSVEQADKATPNFSWSKFLAAEKLAGTKGFSLSQPKFFAEFDKMLVEVPAADWQAYLRYHVLNDAAPYLHNAASNERFAFYGKTMRGQQEQKPRWKRVLDTVNGTLGEALGQIYVEQVFPEESKTQMLALVNNLREALKTRLEKLDWMSKETKAKAIEKWNTFDPKIGYPDKWRDYSGLDIRRDVGYLANVEAAGAFENAFQMSKIGKPADPKEWGMPPQTVNAYYNPLKNEIVFPAAILQPPFFDPQADPALNYGGIGAVIGHEMLHGYDDEGSQFDAAGNNKNWWSEEDMKNFKARTAKLVTQFDEYVAIDDLHVKGELTLGENIADLGGITVALDALNRDLMNKRMAPIDGYTQQQRFFLNWAVSWRRHYRPEEMRVRLNTDPHAPPRFRANGAPSNLEAFAGAFNCKPTDGMVRSADKRVVIW